MELNESSPKKEETSEEEEETPTNSPKEEIEELTIDDFIEDFKL